MKTFLFDLDGTLLGADENEFMHAYFGELTRALHGLLPAEGLASNILAATSRMQADTSPGSSNLVKFRREFEALYQGVDQQAVWDRIMEFYATTFDNVHDVMRRNDCTKDMSAHLVGIETYLVTDYVIGDAASSGADHISDALGFERWVLANY